MSLHELLILVLVAAFLVGSGSADPSNGCLFWAHNLQYSTPAIGGNIEAIDCVFSGNTTISIIDTSISSVVTLLIQRGTTGNSSGITLLCPSAETSNLTGPMNVTITGVTFGVDSIFVLVGSLPPRSSLSITNNSFQLSQRHANSDVGAWTDPSLVGAVFIGIGYDTFSLTSSSFVLVGDNAIILTNLKSTEVGNAVTISATTILVSGGSTFAVVHNIVTDSYIPESYLFMIVWKSNTALSVTIEDSSVFAMDNNFVTNSNTGAYAVVIRWAVSAANVRVARNSSFSLSNNGLSNVDKVVLNADNVAVAVSWYIPNGVALTVAGGSNAEIVGNRVASTTAYYANAVRFNCIQGPIEVTLSGYSFVNFSENSVSDVRASDVISVIWVSNVAMSLTVTGHSTLEVSKNKVSNTQSFLTIGASALVSALLRVNVHNSSAVSLNGNTIHNSTVPTVLVVSISGIDHITLVVCNGSSIRVNNNSVSASDGKLQVVLWKSDRLVSLSISDRSEFENSGNGAHERNDDGRLLNVISFDNSPQLLVAISLSSSFRLDGNYINNSVATTGSVIAGAAAFSVIFTVSGDSSLSFSHNTIKYSNFREAVAVISFVDIGGNISFSSLRGSNISISGNRIGDCTANASVYVMLWSLTSSAVVAVLTAEENSSVSFSSNVITSSSANSLVAVLHMIGPRIWLNSTHFSSIILSRNAVHRVTSSASDISCLSFEDTSQNISNIVIANNSIINISGNTLLNVSTQGFRSEMLVLRLFFAIVLVDLSKHSGLYFHCNTLDSGRHFGVGEAGIIRWTVSPPYTNLKMFTLSDNALISVSANVMRNINATRSDAIGLHWDMYAVRMEVTDTSSITISGTCITNVAGSTVTAVSFAEISALYISGYSTLALTDNSVSNVTASVGIVLISLIFGITIRSWNRSNSFIEGNGITSSSAAAYVYGIRIDTPLVSIAENTLLSLSRNSINMPTWLLIPESRATLLRLGPALSFRSTAKSILRVEGNSGESQISPLISWEAMELRTGSIASLSGNVLSISRETASWSFLQVHTLEIDNVSRLLLEDNSARTETNVTLLFKVINGTTFSGAGKVRVCRNSLNGTAITDLLQRLSPPSLVDALVNCSLSSSPSPSINSTLSIAIASLSTDHGGTRSSNYSLSLIEPTESDGSATHSLVPTPTQSSNYSLSLIEPTESDGSATHSLVPTPTAKLNVTYRPLVPVPAAVDAAKQVAGAAGAIVAVTAVASATGGQLGVANAMMRLADCSSKDGDYGGSLPILVHPLQFTFGDRDYQINSAAALSNTLLVPIIITLLALGPVRLVVMRARSVSSHVALQQIGWPSLLILPFANLAEGIGVTTVVALKSGRPFGIAMGFVACAVLLTFVGSWLWTLARVIPRRKLTLMKKEHEKGGNRAKDFLWRIVRPSRQWTPVQDEEGLGLTAAFVERYSNAVGDKAWYYGELASFLCSIAVGVAESLPSSTCKVRAIIGLIPALAQCGLSITALIPLERLLQSLLTLCLVPLYFVVITKVFTQSQLNDTLDEVMAVLSAAGNVIGICIMIQGLLVGSWEIFTTHRPMGRSAHKRKKEIPESSLDVPMLRLREPEANVEEPARNDSKSPRESQLHLLGPLDIKYPRVASPPVTKTKTVAEVLAFIEQTIQEEALASEHRSPESLSESFQKNLPSAGAPNDEDASEDISGDVLLAEL